MKKYNQKGFTIVEVLAVMVVFIAIGSIAAATFFTSLRTVNKTNSLATLRENGNYALSQMTKTIRYATQFNGVSSTGATGSFTTACDAAPVKDTEYPYIQITGYDDQATTFHCITGDGGNIASNSATSIDNPSNYLLDSSVVKRVNACSFACTQSDAQDYPTITIRLTLSETGTLGVVEKNTTLPLKTSVTFRNSVAQ